MFTIFDGRKQFYQWDIDRKLVVEDDSIKEVHFCNKTDECSLVCETYKDNNTTLVNVPNILLTTNWRINVYAFDGKATKHSATFNVVSRTKPADYIYTETEIKNYEDLAARIEELEKNEVGYHGIARFATMPAAESKYLDWIVLYTGATNDTYVNNTMYICVNNDGYKWVKYTLAQIPQKLIASTSYGTMIDDYNYISVYPAAESTIKQGTHAYQPVAVKNFGYAVGCNGIVRLSTIPTAANKYEGWVVLYTGETNETYTKNTMYECVNDGGYKWVEYTPAPIGDIQAALDSIIAIQNSFLGGE